MRLLILGGTTEANALARHVARRQDLAPVLSLAGRTRHPAPPPIPCRVGGFGGIAGLKAYLSQHRTHAVIDATHPFAAQMSRHAVTACAELGLPIAALTRPPWHRGDLTTTVPDIPTAVRALGENPRRVFLTVGGIHLAAFARAPHHHYLVRSIDPPAAIRALPSHRLIRARFPFDRETEIALMRGESIDTLVTKNSGGAATEAKLTAASCLGIPVIMIQRPPPEAYPIFQDIDAILAWIEAHRSAP